MGKTSEVDAGMRVGSIFVAALLGVAALAWAADVTLPAEPAGEASSPSIRVVSQTSSEIVFTVELPHYALDTLRTGGRLYTSILAPGLVPFAGEGEPNLPAMPVLLAVPPGGEARLVSVEPLGERALEGLRILPVEHVVATGEDQDRFAQMVYTEKDSIYNSSSAFPGQTAWLRDRGRLRHQDVVRVMVAPFRYEPARSRLLAASQVTVRVSFQGGTLREMPLRSDGLETIYKDAILNYEQGRHWRQVSAPQLEAPQTGASRVKITIAKTGIYNLAFEDLAAIGFPGNLPIGDVYLYRDTFKEGSPDTLSVQECALQVIDADGDGVFSSGDAIRFYARDFYDEYGRRSNQDFFFDKNIYWLSWGEGEHLRIASRPGWRETASPARPATFPDFIHVEQDSYFVNFPPQPAGELTTDLYVWTRQRRITPFDLPGVDTSLATELVANFVSYYNSDGDYSLQPRQSTIALYMTGCAGVQTPIGTVAAALPSAGVDTLQVPAGLLCETGDRFRFESSILAAAASPGNVLDWFEVNYRRKYQAYQNALSFTSGDSTGVVELGVGGFSGGDISVLDITDPTEPVTIQLSPGQITQDGGAYKVTFRDSISAERRYVALTPSAVINVSAGAIALKPPPSTRNVQADYVIVSHPNFTSDIQSLVARKQAQGLSVFVATIDEVYDDFGNGMKSDVAIKRFIKQAFFGGDAQFVLLVGDANIDHRGVLLGIPWPGPQIPSDVDYVPTHSFVRSDGLFFNNETRPSDNWYVTLDGDDDPYPDLYIGRLPVSSSAETNGMLNKMATYETYAGSSPWKKRFLIVSDDEYKFAATESDPDCWSGSDTDFMWSCDSVAYIARNLAVVAPDTVKYYLARCLKDDQPDKRCDDPSCCTVTSTTRSFTRANCTPDVLSRFGEGALIVNYQGHSNRYEFTHERLIIDDASHRDILDLANSEKPFVFIGLGCWMSDFQLRTEAASFIQESIGEKFVLNPNGAACASFSSPCSEYISANASFDIILARTIFGHLVGLDPQGNPIPARILLGEATMNALIRYGVPSYASRYILFGDPAMQIDMGPPEVSVAVDGSPVDTAYVFTGATFDTVEVTAEIKDEEAVMATGLDLVEGDVTTPVAPGDFSVQPLVDQGFSRSRAYGLTYRHAPHLGEYAVRISGRDYAGKTSAFDLRISTGSATFFKDEAALPEGATLVLGQVLRVRLTRPIAFAESDIDAKLDGVPAKEFPGYWLLKKDQDGKVWEISLAPALETGTHSFTVSVSGFTAQRSFAFLAARVEFLADGRGLYDNDFVAADADLQIRVSTAKGFSGDEIKVELDGGPYAVGFLPDTSGTVVTWTGHIPVMSAGLLPGSHQVVVKIQDFSVPRSFRISERLEMLDVSAFPNPFSTDTYFFYTLSEEAREARLVIYTVSGRQILEVDVGAYPGYNQYRWDGRDARGDRVANGAYIYKLVVKGSGGERQAVGRIVRLD